jgi:hypothetical protein
VLFQPVGIAGGLQSVALFSRGDIHLLCYGVLDKVGIKSHLLVGSVDVLKGEIYQTVFFALAPMEAVLQTRRSQGHAVEPVQQHHDEEYPDGL